ncbi:MAG: DUF2188 domain-containing protein [Planctomycetes bacterium]|nr:DUF2188 domain-containing protein [Planctomycetota bacterium]
MFLKWLFSARKKTKSGTYHIVWDSDSSKWFVKKDGEQNPVSDHETKKSALDAGDKIGSELATGQLIVHKMDGDVQKSVNYGRQAA